MTDSLTIREAFEHCQQLGPNAIAAAHDKSGHVVVMITHEGNAAWIRCTAAEARGIAASLIRHAEAAERRPGEPKVQ